MSLWSASGPVSQICVENTQQFQQCFGQFVRDYQLKFSDKLISKKH